MLQVPSRKITSSAVSENTKRILAGISKSVLPSKPIEAPLPNKLAFIEAIASGRFTADKFGIYKEADNGADLGKIWVKKHITEADGSEADWLVVYTNDEDEIIRQLASEKLREGMLQKTAASAPPKQPNPKDVPIAPGIKSKNITMDQSGASGTAKVTVEFTDTDQALKFYQDQGEPQQKAAPTEGEAEEGEGDQPKNIQTGTTPPVPPTPQQPAPQVGPRMTNLKPTIQNMSRFGQQVAYVIKKEATEEEKKDDDKKDDEKEVEDKEEKKESSLTYSFINEHSQEILLPWTTALRVGSVFERPDTGTSIRLAGYIEQKLTPVSSLVDELIVLAGKPYHCETCDTGFSEGQMNFHKNHTYKKKDGEDKEDDKKEDEKDEKVDDKEEKKESSQKYADVSPYKCAKCGEVYDKLPYAQGKVMCTSCGGEIVKNSSQKTAADISDEVPPMGWDSGKGQQAPSNAGPSLPPQQNLQDNKPDANVLYDSNQDSGPQFQTTINPKDKSVNIKFIDSVAQDALQQAVNKPAPNLTQPQQAPAPPAQPPPQGQGQPGAQQNQSFQQQEVPVTF